MEHNDVIGRALRYIDRPTMDAIEQEERLDRARAALERSRARTLARQREDGPEQHDPERWDGMD